MPNFSKTSVLHSALVSILGSVVSSCNLPASEDTLLPDDKWQGVRCDTNNKKDLLSGLNGDDSVDGMLLYYFGGQVGSFIEDAGGTPCAKAVNVEQCRQSIDDLQFAFNTPALIFTKGDEIKVLKSKEEVKTYLGELDNPQKVFSWMHIHDMSLSCDFNSSAVTQQKNINKWSAVYVEITRDCTPITADRVKIEIDASTGSIEELERVEISRSEGCIGRSPPGKMKFQAMSTIDCDSLGKSLATHAALEAASVIAFEHLKCELKILGAPQCLLQRIEKAAADEVRHAQMVGLLAQRYGHQPDKVYITQGEIRDAESIAIDNMREGCIGETWGALLGLYQAQVAEDPIIAIVMQSIALDEVEHAALSWEINDWLYSLLNETARQHVQDVKESAINAVVTKAKRTCDVRHTQLAGLPQSVPAQIMASQFLKLMASQA